MAIAARPRATFDADYKDAAAAMFGRIAEAMKLVAVDVYGRIPHGAIARAHSGIGSTRSAALSWPTGTLP
jgi:hypothetical protein